MGANLRGANLARAGLAGTTGKANLYEANLDGAVFKDTVMPDWHGPSSRFVFGTAVRHRRWAPSPRRERVGVRAFGRIDRPPLADRCAESRPPHGRSEGDTVARRRR